MPTYHDTIIIGGGQAGLALSFQLTQAGHDHLVVERGRIGETWRTQRWDGFRLNSPNWMNALPGESPASDPHAFGTARDLAARFERYAERFALPVRTGVEVAGVERAPGRDGYRVRCGSGGGLLARSVVLASGWQNAPRTPGLARRLSPTVEQVHAAAYRNPEALAPGAVLVVGSARSGLQIAEELAAAGRRVLLATSRVGRMPRRHRGRDTAAWLVDSGFYDVQVEALEDPAARFAAEPQLSGTRGGHTVSLQQLARDGVELLGRLQDAEGTVVRTGGDVAAHARHGDETARRLRVAIDHHLARQGIDAPPEVRDPAEDPVPALFADRRPRTVDLLAEGVSAVVWCTGFGADLRFLRVPVPRERGVPEHRGGATASPGLFMLGAPWLRTRSSGVLRGAGADAAHVAAQILARSADVRRPRAVRAARVAA